jgi:hypothetical protein
MLTDDFESLGVARFHGRPVELLRGGVVKLVGPSHRRPLRFRISVQEAKRILEVKKTSMIHFAHEDISLHIGNDVVCRKQIERLLAY